MLKKLFHSRQTLPPPFVEASSSSESGESEIVSHEEILAATKDFNIPRRFTNGEFAPKVPKDGGERDKLKSKQPLKKSRSFSFHLRPSSSSLLKIPRSKSVHFADDIQVLKHESPQETPATTSTKSPESLGEENRSTSSVYTDETAESSNSEETLKRVGESLENIFHRRTADPDTLTAESQEASGTPTENFDYVTNLALHSFSSVLFGIYKHICNCLQLKVHDEGNCTPLQLETCIHTGIEDLATNLKSTTDIMLTLKAKLKSMEDKEAEIRDAYIELQKECQRIKRENAKLREEHIKHDSAEINLGQNNSSCETKIDHHHLNAAYREIDDVVSKFSTELEKHEKALEAKGEEITHLKRSHYEEIGILRTQLKQVIDQNAEYEHKLLEAFTENEEIIRQMSRLEQDCESQRFKAESNGIQLNEKLSSDHTKEMELLRAKLEAEKDSVVCTLNAEKSQLQSQIEREMDNNRKCRDSCQSLRSELKSLSLRHEEAEIQNCTLRRELGTLKDDIVRSAEEYESQIKEIAERDTEKIKKTQLNNTTLRSQVLSMDSQIDKLAKQLRLSQNAAAEFKAETEAITLKLKTKHQQYEELAVSNSYAVDTLKKLIKSVFEAMAPTFHHDSTLEYTQVYYRYSEIKLFNSTHHSTVTLLYTFIITGVRDLARELFRTAKRFETEMANHVNYQKAALQAMVKISRQKSIQSVSETLSQRFPREKSDGCKKSRQEKRRSSHYL